MKSVWTLLESACAAPEVSRRTLLLGALSAVGLTACGQSAPRDSSERTSVVRLYKSPTCQCCSAWGEHLKQNGFEVEFHNETQINAFKASVGVPETLWSCHTALIGGYAIEGHVPASDIQRLLRERPAYQGLAVPGMPLGSPGMESGADREAYEVLAYSAAAETVLWSRHE